MPCRAPVLTYFYVESCRILMAAEQLWVPFGIGFVTALKGLLNHHVYFACCCCGAQEPPPAKTVKPLPKPDEHEGKKRRGGVRLRKMKERWVVHCQTVASVACAPVSCVPVLTLLPTTSSCPTECPHSRVVFFPRLLHCLQAVCVRPPCCWSWFCSQTLTKPSRHAATPGQCASHTFLHLL